MSIPDHLELFDKLKRSLENAHPAMNVRANPVLVDLANDRIDLHQALGRGTICVVSQSDRGILSAMHQRLRAWPNVHEELRRNIGEELGDGTAGISHVTILKRALRQELGLDVETTVPSAGTIRFFETILDAISDRTLPFVAGMAYALEDSALPELEIVATAITTVGRLSGHRSELVCAGLKIPWSSPRDSRTEATGRLYARRFLCRAFAGF